MLQRSTYLPFFYEGLRYFGDDFRILVSQLDKFVESSKFRTLRKIFDTIHVHLPTVPIYDFADISSLGDMINLSRSC